VLRLRPGILLAMVVSAWLGACSQTASPAGALPPAQVSGSRLQARVLTGPDGLTIPFGWMDSQLGTPCRIQPAEDGAHRCLPDPVVSSFQIPDYSDAACTAPVIALSAFCPAHYGGDPPVFFASPTGYVPVTAKLSANTQAYFLKGGCDAFPLGTVQVYTVGAPLPVSAFAQASVVESSASGGRLQPRYQISDDGAQELIGIEDTMRGATCSPQPAADGTTRCLPDGTAAVDQFGDLYYADPNCTQVAIAVGSGDPAAPPSVAYTVSGPPCERRRIYALGARQTLSTVYLQQDGACVAFQISGDYFVGDEIAPTAFEALTFRDVGSGRIRERVLVAATGQVVARGFAWLDSQLGVPVYPESIDGQNYALVPVSAGPPVYNTYFSDAACAQEELLVEVTPDACAALPSSYAVVSGATSPACSPPQVFPLGPPVNRQQVYGTETGICALPKDAPSDPMVTQPELHPLGPAVDTSAFVQVTVTVQ